MQKQQQVSYDLLAVFPDESKANTASDKLKKAGFTDEEIHRLTPGVVGSGQFREHGPNSARQDYFLQTGRSGPRPALVILFAAIFGIILGGLSFGASFELRTLSAPIIITAGVILGVILGSIFGAFQRGKVRGSIGQVQTNAPPATPTSTSTRSGQNNALTVIALRFEDPDNVSRNSRARAIMLNNQGKIDRSVTRKQ